MIKVEKTVGGNLLKFQGNMPDILTYLEKEQERCGKISVLQYIKALKLEKAKNAYYSMQDLKRGLKNAKR